jgi:hypothetical protein
MPTPEEWRHKLLKRLDDRAFRIRRYVNYHEGRHDTRYITQEFREAFGRLFSGYAENFCPLVADAVEERLAVVGFRLGKDLKADDDANRIWQENRLDAESQLCHSEALVKSEAAVIISPYRSEWPRSDTPLITIEDPLQVYVALDPSNRGTRLAAIKRWTDEDGHVRATLYLPNAIYKWRSAQKESDFSLNHWQDYVTVQWERRQGDDDEWPLRNPLDMVPVIPFVNRPRLDRSGRSEFEEVMPVQDAVNQVVRDMLLVAEIAGFPQRYGINLEPEVDEATGQPVERYKASIKRLWLAPPPEDGEPETKFGQFPSADLTPLIKMVEQRIQHIATITRTPPHYLLGSSGTFPSGESLKATETGLVAKVKEKQRYFGESWEEVMRVAFAALGDRRQDVTDSEAVWSDPESRTEAEHVDALTKMASLRVPNEALWERWGASPTEIARWKAQLAEEAMVTAGSIPDAEDIGGKFEAAGAAVRAGWHPDDALKIVGLPPMRHLGLPPVTLKDVKIDGDAGNGAAELDVSETA